MVPSENEVPIDPALVEELSLDDTTLEHVGDLIDAAAPMHEDCLPCRRLRQAIEDHAARVGEHRVDGEPSTSD